MVKRNRYRNPLKTPGLFRVLFICVALGMIGACFVTIRIRHVTKGDEITNREEQIEKLNQEIEMWELRIAGVMDRDELSRRLRWKGSDLQDIDPMRVWKIEPFEREFRDIAAVEVVAAMPTPPAPKSEPDSQ